MRILVFGGSVFLSRTVAEQALSRGYDVTCASRGVSGTPPPGARHVVVDRDDPDGPAPLAGRHFDAVVDVARRPSHVRRALAAVTAGHWTFVSTGNVYADTATPGQRAEDAPLLDPAGRDADETDDMLYGPLKVACEQAVHAVRGEDAFVVRAGLIGGPYDVTDRFSYWPLRLARDEEGLGRGREVLAPDKPGNAAQVIDVRDLAAWFLDSAERGRTGTHDGVGPPLPIGTMLARIATALDADVEFTWVDQEFLLANGVERYMGPKSLPLWVELPGYAGWSSRDASAAYAAGLTCRDIEQTAVDTLAWERTAGRAHPVSAGLTGQEERELLARWKSSS